MAIVLKSKIAGNPQTDLDPVITGLRWGKGFDFGKGANAITGGLAGNALQPFTPKLREEKASSSQYRFIQDESDLRREIEASVSGKYNIEGIDITASTEYLSSIKFSDLTVTLIAEYESHYLGYDEGQNYQFTDEAKKLLSNPAEFRRAYGDYFIAGGLRGSRFIAVYICKASSVEEMNGFKAKFKGEAPEVFEAEGSAEFMQAASENHINLSLDLKMVGYKGTPPGPPWTPEKIATALNWFVEHEQGVYLEALLQHYKTIDPSYPRTIDIAPSVFIDLHLLYTSYWDMSSLYSSCPKYYQDQYVKEYRALTATLKANESVLATDASLRVELQQKADILLSQLKAINERQDFYFRVKKAISTEPREGASIEDIGGVRSWLYGYKDYIQSSNVVISSTEMRYSEAWHIGWRENTFQFGPDSKYLIVGWEVIANWPDGTDGQWWKATSQILLTHLAAVHVKSQYDRGCDWSFRVYYVDAKDYQFGETVQSDEVITLTRGRQYILTLNNRPTSINERDMAQIINWTGRPGDGFYVDVIGLTMGDPPRVIIQARENNTYPERLNGLGEIQYVTRQGRPERQRIVDIEAVQTLDTGLLNGSQLLPEAEQQVDQPYQPEDIITNLRINDFNGRLCVKANIGDRRQSEGLLQIFVLQPYTSFRPLEQGKPYRILFQEGVASLLYQGEAEGALWFASEAGNIAEEAEQKVDQPRRSVMIQNITGLRVRDLYNRHYADAATGIYSRDPRSGLEQIIMGPSVVQRPLQEDSQYIVSSNELPGKYLYYNGDLGGNMLWFASQ